MSFADNLARVIVVITFLTFGEAQIIGGKIPNLIAFGLYLGAIGYFAATGKMENARLEKQEIMNFNVVLNIMIFFKVLGDELI